MGCLYLIVKGLELAGVAQSLQGDGKNTGFQVAGAVIALLGAFIFFLLLNGQVDASGTIGGY